MSKTSFCTWLTDASLLGIWGFQGETWVQTFHGASKFLGLHLSESQIQAQSVAVSTCNFLNLMYKYIYI